jgi:predicted transcriptional regulator YheO
VRVQVEFTIEPFVEGSPGEHVSAAIASMRADGFEVEIGPFSSSVNGDVALVSSAVSRMTYAAMVAGATSVAVNISVISLVDEGTTRSKPTRTAASTSESATSGELAPDPLLDLIQSVEAELGSELHLLDRVAKQRSVRLLDERGAFRFRGAVEEIADVMNVSRVTIYNYLKAIRRN